jgi:hypothetical protein
MSIISVAGMIFRTIDAGEMQYTNMTIPTTAKTINWMSPPPLPRGPMPIFSGGFSLPIKITSFYDEKILSPRHFKNLTFFPLTLN